MGHMEEPNPSRLVRIALLFEGGLGIIAIAIGWLASHSPFVGLSNNSQSTHHITAIGWGLVATGPLLVALVLLDHVTWEPIRRLRELAGDVILRMFAGASAGQLAAISLAAGFGEELLFRGLIQAGLSRWIGGPVGIAFALVLASVLFGVCHWLNTTYALLAMLAGAYFGLLLVATENILTPLTAHAAYDFLALVHLLQPDKLLGSEE
jgi:uncharacterized protein